MHDLCRRFEIKPRTLFEDIRELKEKIGSDIRFDKARGGYYNASPEGDLPTYRLTEEEYLVMVAGQQLLMHYGGPSFQTLATNALEKLLPEGFGALPKVESTDRPVPVKLNVFLQVMKACGGAVVIGVGTNGRAVSIVPQSVILKDSQWHLRGVDAESGAEVTIPLKEISDISREETNGEMQ